MVSGPAESRSIRRIGWVVVAILMLAIVGAATAWAFWLRPIETDPVATAPSPEAIESSPTTEELAVSTSAEYQARHNAPYDPGPDCTDGASVCAFDNGLKFDVLREDIIENLPLETGRDVNEVDCDSENLGPPNHVGIGQPVICVAQGDGDRWVLEVPVVKKPPFGVWRIADPPRGCKDLEAMDCLRSRQISGFALNWWEGALPEVIAGVATDEAVQSLFTHEYVSPANGGARAVFGCSGGCKTFDGCFANPDSPYPDLVQCNFNPFASPVDYLALVMYVDPDNKTVVGAEWLME
jgi:hypothetical protein